MPKLTSLLKTVVMIALVGCGVAWLTMWVTEDAIWSAPSPRCEAYATIELKGHVYRTCSYLAARYKAGENGFTASWIIMAIGIGLGIVMGANDTKKSDRSTQ
jgi:hypothetical protein